MSTSPRTRSLRLPLAIALCCLATTVSTSVRADERPAEPAPTSSRAEVAETKDDGDEDREPFRVGAIAGIGFPRPFAIEALIKIDRVVALGAEYSFLPTMTLGGVKTSFSAIAADLRVFPFRGGFFVGLRAGHQSLSATTTLGVDGLGSITESGSAEAWFVNPRIGFLWTWKNGLTVGIDAGVQLPVSSSLSTTLPDGLPVQVTSSISSVASTFGNDVTPTVDLLRVGFLF